MSGIPDQALDGRLAIVGITGSGKGTTAKGGVEHTLATRRRVCVVDLFDHPERGRVVALPVLFVE